jgi:cbb3-type cytochrome oxidase maturation protein
MSPLAWLIPLALGMGVIGLLAFLWSMKSGQLEDLDGAAERILLHEAGDTPLQDKDRLNPGSQTKRDKA